MWTEKNCLIKKGKNRDPKRIFAYFMRFSFTRGYFYQKARSFRKLSGQRFLNTSCLISSSGNYRIEATYLSLFFGYSKTLKYTENSVFKALDVFLIFIQILLLKMSNQRTKVCASQHLAAMTASSIFLIFKFL